MNLLSKLHKNSILTGPVESYCLACGCLLQSEEESYAHIQDPGHVDNLSAVPQLADYNDCILKSKEGYFCRYCNIILPTIKRVSLHTADSKHTENRNSQSITRLGNVIFAFESVIINDRSWNGLDESTCSICNEDYDDEETHKQGAMHILNLIQTKCEFGQSYVYRKVDEDSFFCLICNLILPIDEKPTHHENEKHVENYENSKKEASAILTKNNASSEPNNNSRTLPTSEAKHQIQNTNEEKDIKPKNQENKAQNEGTHAIDKPTTNKIIQEAIVNTESQASISKPDSQNKTVEITKHNTQENKLDSQNKTTPASTETEKETVKLNTDTVQTSKESKSESQNNQNIQELKDKPKPPSNTNSVTKDTQTNNSEALKTKPDTKKTSNQGNGVNGTAKVQADNPEPCFYEFLKSNNFVTKRHDHSPFCALCDISIDAAGTESHIRTKHHSTLYAKHMARKTSQLSKKIETMKGQDDKTDSKSETNDQLKTKANTVPEKENKALVSEPTNNQKSATFDNVKVEAAQEKVVAQDTKATEKKPAPVIKQTKTQETVIASNEKPEKSNESKPVTQDTTTPLKNQENKLKESKLTDKEDKTPVNKNDDSKPRRNSNERNNGITKQEPTEPTVQNKKSIKKAQKKAAKAKAAETTATIKPKEIDETGAPLSKLCEVSTGETTTEKHRSLANDSSKALTENTESVNVNSKESEEYDVLHTEVQDSETMASRFATGAGADLKTEKLLKLLKTVSQVDSADDVVVNAKHVLGNLSFVLVVHTDEKADCVACDVELTRDETHKHIVTDLHRSNVEDSVVVTSLENEFIRQMKSKKYHCGYCNILLPNWNSLKSHLETFRHSDARTSAAWRLERYHPHLRRCETKEVRSVLTTIFRCTRE